MLSEAFPLRFPDFARKGLEARRNRFAAACLAFDRVCGGMLSLSGDA